MNFSTLTFCIKYRRICSAQAGFHSLLYSFLSNILTLVYASWNSLFHRAMLCITKVVRKHFLGSEQVAKCQKLTVGHLNNHVHRPIIHLHSLHYFGISCQAILLLALGRWGSYLLCFGGVFVAWWGKRLAGFLAFETWRVNSICSKTHRILFRVQ
jgi:hypothetical protein